MNDYKKTIVFAKNLNENPKGHFDVVIKGFGHKSLVGPIGFCLLVIDEKLTEVDIQKDAMLLKHVYFESDSVHTIDDVDMAICKMLNNELKKIKKLTSGKKISFYSEDINTNFDRFNNYNIRPINKYKKSYYNPLNTFVDDWVKGELLSLEKIYPNFNFSSHLGLATKEHFEEIKEFGYSKAHFRKLSAIEELGLDECFKFVKMINSINNINDISLFENCNIGIDEVGVRSLFGSVVCSFVLLPENHSIRELPIDSKRLSDSRISNISKKILDLTPFSATFSLDSNFVDKYGYDCSNKILWHYCYSAIRKTFPKNRIIIDGGKTIPDVTNTYFIPRADSKMDFVSAASIISKYFCDEEIRYFHEFDPRFELSKNKGYDTLDHIELLNKYGVSPLHRSNFIKKTLENTSFDIPELELTYEELNEIVDTLLLIYKLVPNLFSDFKKNLLFGNLKRIQQQQKISKKVMFCLYSNCVELLENCKNTVSELKNVSITKKEIIKKTFSFDSLPIYEGNFNQFAKKRKYFRTVGINAKKRIY